MTNKVEDPFYYFVDGWYKGSFPGFYPVTEIAASEVLKSHYPFLKEEIVAFYEKHSERFKNNYTPYSYDAKGWKTINLFSYFLRYNDACGDFPSVLNVVSKIPNVCGVQIGVLEPNTRIKAHMGDTNAIVRTHLGIQIPGTYPDLGFRVGTEERCWSDGEVLALCVGHRHYAWNYTDKHRIVLVIDTIRNEYSHRKFEIAGKTMAVVALRHFSTKYPILKRTPRWLALLTRDAASYLFRFLLYLQRTFGIRIEKLLRPRS